MFIQVITARVVDADGLSSQFDRWVQEVRPGADGFVGSTSGVTDDGRFIALARFESEEAARRNSDRAEQAAWWAETEKMLDQVEFRDGTKVVTMRGGGSNDAGFVQMMRGRVLDAAKLDELLASQGELEDAMASHRPDVIGSVSVVHDDGTYTDAIYFTSEAEARSNEGKEMPAEMQAMFEEWSSAATVEEYLDLKTPRLI